MPEPGPDLTAEALAEGGLHILGLLPASSNYTFLARLGEGGPRVVYKPRRGETPLWDFPTGTLCQREVAAYLVSEAGGWDLVPATVLRDGPLGPGAVQLFVEHDPGRNAFNLGAEHEPALRRMAVLDLLMNNADRKAGHVLAGPGERLWGVDHGLCFHAEPKLRTVLWDYIGEPFAPADLEALSLVESGLAGSLGAGLAELLHPGEIAALAARASRLRSAGVYPEPGPGRPYPWPPV